MKFDKIVKENLPLAIRIQHDIFPLEDGSPFLIFSVEKRVVSHLNMLDYWLAYENEKVVGIVGLYSYEEYPNEAWLGWFGVLENCRRKGFGKRIFDWAKNEAIKRGFENLRLYTDRVANAVAVKFYKKQGMIVEEYDNATDLHSAIGRTLICSISLAGNSVDKWRSKSIFLRQLEDCAQSLKDSEKI
ncbi:MAG: GNAT family N-acetyltransferase [Clostridia bacterium]|nr:GNAT family N-acetyltransferase [Clostridia bacterium]